MDHIYHNAEFGENWFTYPTVYSDMVKRFPSGSTFVEIGSWKGKSSAYMAVEIANSGKSIDFVCVDTFEGGLEHINHPDLHNLYDVFNSNMSSLKNYYRDLRMTSLEASKLFDDKSIDFVFIDAGHDYENVRNDILAWKPKVKDGGILAGHDYVYTWPGVIKAVDEMFPNQIQTMEYCWIYTV